MIMYSDEDIFFAMWVALHTTRDAVYNARSKALSQYGISPREAAVLHAIYSIDEEVTPSAISRWTYRTPQTIKGILDRMHQKGLIERKKDLKYKNLVRINLTEKGKRAHNNSLRRKELSRIFKGFAGEECDRFIAYLTRVRDSALKETGDSIQRPFP